MNKRFSGDFNYKLLLTKNQRPCERLNLLDLKPLKIIPFNDSRYYEFCRLNGVVVLLNYFEPTNALIF